MKYLQNRIMIRTYSYSDEEIDPNTGKVRKPRTVRIFRRVCINEHLAILVVNGHTGNDSRRPIIDLGELFIFFSNMVKLFPCFTLTSLLECLPSFIQRAVLHCGVSEVTRFLSNSSCISKPFLCESDTTEDSVRIMEQAWEALLSNTLLPVKDADVKEDSIVSAINRSYSEISSGYITSAQTEFDKLFVKVVCTAFSVCSTVPTKNSPTFERHRDFTTSEGKNLQVFTRKIYQDMLAHACKQIEKMSKVMISEIKAYRRDRCIPSSLKMWPKRQFDYAHFMRKTEDVRKMVGCTGTDGAVVCTWQSKFRDAKGEKKKGGVSCLFLHQWLILCHFVDVNVTKIKFTNVSAALIDPCTVCGGAEVAFNDCPINVEALHRYIKESDENNEEVLL